MNKKDIEQLQQDAISMGVDPRYFEDECIEDPIPKLIEQLGIYERYVLYHYKHQKLIYADRALHPDDIINAVQAEALMYEATYGMSDHIQVMTPYDDYLYLRDELLKNPLDIGTKPEELLLAYMFCLCKDTRQELWHGQIEQCEKSLEHIFQLYITIQDLLRNLHELWLKDEHPVSHHETAYYSPVSNQLRYKFDPDYDNQVLAALGRKKTSQLSEWHQYQFKQLLKTTTIQKNEKWKSVSAAIAAVIDEFEQQLSIEAEQNIQTFVRGRQDFIQLYQLTLNRLQIELKDNAWLIDHPANEDRLEIATQKIKYLKQLIREQKKLLEVPEGEIYYKNLVKTSYTERTLSDWINDDPELRKEIIISSKTNKDKK